MGKPDAVDIIIHLTFAAFLMFAASIFIVPQHIDDVFYKYVNQSELRRPPFMGLSMDADGTAYNGSPIIILINNKALLVNWSLRHENCHARQFMENRKVNEFECYARMMLPWE